jgi:hypothetical protein
MALPEFKGDKERIKNLQHLLKSRPLGPLLKRNLSDSTGIVPGSTITLPITQDHTLIGQEAIDGQKIIDKYDLARGGKKSRKKRRKKKKKSRKKRKKKSKKKKKSRRRNKKAGFLFTGLGYYLYQTKMNGKKAIFNLPVQYKDSEPVAKVAQADPTPPPAKGGKKSRKKRKRKRKRKKTRKRRGGADGLRDGIKRIYESKYRERFLGINGGPGSWGRQLNDLYAEYLKHLRFLSSGQKVARKFKNLFRNATTTKPLTQGEADRIFYGEANNMIGILERNFLMPTRQSIQEINNDPLAMIYSDIERESDPEKERLSLQILEERPRLESLEEEIKGSIWELDQLMTSIKRSPPKYIDV